MADRIHWSTIEPKDAVDIDLTKRPDIEGPMGEDGEVCPWPWDPQQLVGAPLGQYRCRYCGSMVVAGIPHPDYREVARFGDAEQDAELQQLRDRFNARQDGDVS
jgi:hypothetical protein